MLEPTLSEAMPTRRLPFTSVPVPSVVAPSLKVTMPVGVPMPLTTAATVAQSGTFYP